MKQILWDKPVAAFGQLIFGPHDARHFFETSWSSPKDLTFTAADRCIADALEGRATPDHARELFEIALRSAFLAEKSSGRLAG
jgi:hypothetical protein